MKERSLRAAAFAKVCFVAAIAISALYGCSVITVPNPEEVIKHPLGTESIKIGMTKQQVELLWGKPDEVRSVENKDRWPGPREMWVYRAQYGAIPFDAGYLSKTKKLYFDGDNLTDIGE